MKPDAMFFHLFLILLVFIPLITTQPFPFQNTCSNPAPLILQPSNTNPHYQAAKLLNPTQIDPEALQDSLNQLVFSKFLTNPSLKSILDPNTKLLSQNGATLRQPTQGSNSNAPSVINNYFIVPPEFFNLNDTLVRKHGKINSKAKRKKSKKLEKQVIKESGSKEGSRSKKGGKRIKSQKLEIIPNPKDEVVLIDEENVPKKRKKIKSNNKKEKLTIKPQSEKLIDISEAVEENAVKKRKKIRKQKLKPIVEIESNDSLKPNQNFQEILELNPLAINSDNIEIEKPKLQKKKRNRTKINEVTRTEDKHLKKIEEPVDNSEQNADLSKNRKIKDSETDNNPKESREKNATPTPDEILKSFYPYFNQFYGNMPFDYEQFYNVFHNPSSSGRKNRRKPNHNKKPKPNTINVKYKANTIPDPKVTEKLDTKTNSDKTTEKPIQTEEMTEFDTEIPQETTTTKEDIVTKENYEAQEDQIEDLQPYVVPELREKAPYNNFINDYYPIFYDQSLYSNENDDSTIRSEESRYFYKTEAADLIRDSRKHDRRERYKPKTFEHDAELIPHIDREGLRNKFKDNSINLEGNTNIFEKLHTKEQQEEDQNENSFRPPPGLENPDFKTRNVKDFEDHKDCNTKDIQLDKLSVYSSTKTDILPEIKRIRVPAKNTRPQIENVETYYANSKVVKYGVPEESTESNESISVSNENEGKINDGHTTYVVAKSLGKIDDYYW